MYVMTNHLNKMTENTSPLPASAFFRYLPLDPDARTWELQVLDAGYTNHPAGIPYPLRQHPEAYTFTWRNGRVLDEYQLIYITGGCGELETRSGGRFSIHPGDLFVLFPGEWHRYRPSMATGWRENWVGFTGTYAERIVPMCASPRQPVLRMGHDETLLELFLSAEEWIQSAPPGYMGMLAANTITLLARIRSLSMRKDRPTREHTERMHEARCLLLEQATREVDLPALASSLGLSYSRFRAAFKEQSGFSPKQYQLHIRINRAKALLAHGGQSVGEIADQLGFNSVYYFSRLFKSMTGVSPTAYRRDRTLRR